MPVATIVGAVRTAIAREGKGLAAVPPEDLGALVMKEAVRRSGLPDPALIDEVIMGNCMNPTIHCIARYALLRAGLPITIPAITIHRQCGSGSTAVDLAASLIKAGEGDVYLAGGMESESREPYFLDRPTAAYARNALRLIPNPNELRPTAPPEIGDPPMGITAENIAEQWGVSRAEQDEFAYLSQMKAAKAIKEGRFKDQIVPVVIPQKKGEPIIFDTDEHPRPDTTLESLAKLRPVFKQNGTVTIGSSSGINDAAAALVLTSDTKAKELGLKPLAIVKASASAGVDPNIMGIGPVPATRKVMAKAGLTIGDMDVIELNEAFAAQSIASCRDLDIDWRDEKKLNPNGGAIALGHPVGASLAILIIKAIYELQRIEGRYALVTACCGGGQGVATIIERC